MTSSSPRSEVSRLTGAIHNELLFTAPPPASKRHPGDVVPDPDTLGLTDPTPAGRTYRHGTLSGYSSSGCRCQHCRGRLRQLPRRTARHRRRQTPPNTRTQHRRPHPPRLVPPTNLATRPRYRRTALPRPRARPTPRPRLLATNPQSCIGCNCGRHSTGWVTVVPAGVGCSGAARGVGWVGATRRVGWGEAGLLHLMP
jgi:hypothetical protein